MPTHRTTGAPRPLSRPRRRGRAVPVAVTSAGLLLALTACSTDVGPTSTEDRAVEDVSGVRLETSGTLEVEQGSTTSLTVTAGERVLERLTSDVEDGVLVLGAEEEMPWAGLGPVEYRLVVPRLDLVDVRGSGDVLGAVATGEDLTVTVSGSGSVDLDGVDAEDVSVTLEGSGDVRLEGRTDAADVRVEGSGDYRGRALRAREATVAVMGSGSADVDVTDRLTASVAGSGDVRHSGGAEVEQQVTGSGSVTGN